MERTVFLLLVASFALVLLLVIRDWEKQRKRKKRRQAEAHGHYDVPGFEPPYGKRNEGINDTGGWDIGDAGGGGT